MLLILRSISRVYIFLFQGRCYTWVTRNIRFFRPLYETRGNESPISFRQWFKYKVMGKDSGPYWPIHETSKITGNWRNVHVGVDAAPGISPCCYIQAMGKIFIDDHAQIAPSVGIISANHFMLDTRKHVPGEVRIGKYCRIGIGSVILPGVVLGDFTTVAAGSVVTNSFPKGYCVISGNPAQMAHDYSDDQKIRDKFVRYRQEYAYNGFIPAAQFEDFRKQYLLI